jgi:hypothetical protein
MGYPLTGSRQQLGWRGVPSRTFGHRVLVNVRPSVGVLEHCSATKHIYLIPLMALLTRPRLVVRVQTIYIVSGDLLMSVTLTTCSRSVAHYHAIDTMAMNFACTLRQCWTYSGISPTQIRSSGKIPATSRGFHETHGIPDRIPFPMGSF